MSESTGNHYLKAGNGDGPRAWMRKHDYMPDGYTLMNVTLLLDGTYEGGMVIGHLTRQIPPFIEKTVTLKECCNKLDQLFWENMPDHQCRSGCFDWHAFDAVFGEHSDTIQ